MRISKIRANYLDPELFGAPSEKGMQLASQPGDNVTGESHARKTGAGRAIRRAMNFSRRTIQLTFLALVLGIAIGSGFVFIARQEPNPSVILARVLTYHNDNARTGQNLNETVLTPANVKHPGFKKLFSDPVDEDLWAQPLYVPGVSIPGKGKHNVVYAATEKDSVYAFDADAASEPLWKVSFINPKAGITTVPPSDVHTFGNSREFGITSTPVIDSETDTLYVVAFTKENGKYFYRLHALDIGTGAEKFGGPVVLKASVPGSGYGSVGGKISFDPLHQHIRPGLLLANGRIYITSASFLEDAYHGWVLVYDSTKLTQIGVFNTTPDNKAGGIWMSGAGAAADSSGNVYVATGNGTFDVNSGGLDYGDSYLKLNGATLKVIDFFTPFNEAALNNDDLDLGSGGIMLLPTQPGKHPNLLVSAGKEGRIYLVDRDEMGKFDAKADRVVQTIPNAVGESGCEPQIGCVFDTPAYWQGNVYFAGEGDTLKAFQLKNGLFATTPGSHSTATFGIRGAVPAISANGSKDGIVWVIDTSVLPHNGQAILRAYNADDLSTELYDSNQAGTSDQPGLAVRFTVPTVANGKVYVGTRDNLSVYGLGSP